MVFKSLWRFLAIAFALVSFNSLGCGGNVATVDGNVLLDGKPLADAEVEFTPLSEEGGRPASAQTNEEGYFDLQYTMDQAGAPVGEYEVRIRLPATREGKDGKDIKLPQLPKRYNTETELKRTVEANDNHFEFKLESE